MMESWGMFSLFNILVFQSVKYAFNNILAPTKSDTTFWDTAVRSKLVSSYAFSYFLDDTNTAGGILFGGIDTARYHGQLNWLPLVPTASSFGQPVFVYWQIKLNSIDIEGTSITFNPTDAVIDTGTSLAIFPPETAKMINNKLGLQEIGSGANGLQMYGIRCENGKIPENFPDLTLTFDYITVSISTSTYLFIHPDDNGRMICISGIVGSTISSTSSLILGNVLLRQFYIVFDYGSRKIGIANAYRTPLVNSSLVAGNYRRSPVGTAPASVAEGITYNGRTSAAAKISKFSLFALVGLIFILLI